MKAETVFDTATALTEGCLTPAQRTGASYTADYQYDWTGNRTYETVDGVQSPIGHLARQPHPNPLQRRGHQLEGADLALVDRCRLSPDPGEEDVVVHGADATGRRVSGGRRSGASRGRAARG